jgi:surface polysaccharide O-acyltransferase-like enzyme
MKERKFYIDLVRIIAIYFVIINHSNSVFSEFNKLDDITWGTSAIVYFIAKAGVPLFIMISGTLLLGREEDYKKVLSKIMKTLLILIIWSAVYRMYYSRSFLNFEEIILLIRDISNKPLSTHFWYLYMLVGLYMMLPFIQKMVKGFKVIDYSIYLTIWLLYTSLLPFLRIFKDLTYTSYFSIPLFYGFSGYLVLGYFLANIEITKKIIYIARLSLFASLVTMLVITYHFSSIIQKTSYVLDSNLTFPVVILSASLFILIKHHISNININNTIFTNVLIDISKKTFGIYLIHILVLVMFRDGRIYHFIYDYSLNPVIGLLLYDVFLFLTSYFFVTLIGKIPYVKKIVYF